MMFSSPHLVSTICLLTLGPNLCEIGNRIDQKAIDDKASELGRDELRTKFVEHFFPRER